MHDIDSAKTVYLFTHGQAALWDKSVEALESRGFSKDKIVKADLQKVGNTGDYMAMLWMPPNPNRIKVQIITKVEDVPPDARIGLWKGVSKDDLFEIML